MRLLGLGPILLSLAVGSAPLAAQATGLPTFFGPVRAYNDTELGVSVSRPGGDATGLEGRFGVAIDRADLGFRTGFVDPGGAGDGSFIAGFEARIPAVRRTRDFPLDGAVILGIGRQFVSDDGQTFVPFGVSLGRQLPLEGGSFISLYGQPTLVFADDTNFTLGLGMDLHVRRIPEFRVNAALGDLDGFSIGVFWTR